MKIVLFLLIGYCSLCARDPFEYGQQPKSILAEGTIDGHYIKIIKQSDARVAIKHKKPFNQDS